MEVCIVIGAIILLLAIKGLYDNKKNRIRLKEYIKSHFGQKPNKNFTTARAESIPAYCNSMPQSPISVDNITWNDLDMDSVYYLINSCKCSIGDEYLYTFSATLRPIFQSLTSLKNSLLTLRIILIFGSSLNIYCSR